MIYKNVLADLATTILVVTLGASSAGSPALADDQKGVEGWSIRSVGSGACIAERLSNQPAEFALSSEGPMFRMIVSAYDFPKRKDAYTVSVALDGKSPMGAPALGDGGVMGINMGLKEARDIATSSQVSITVEGHTHSFSLQNSGAALDAAARCAGQQTLSERTDEAPLPIAGAENWKLAVTLPGSSARACSARNSGDQIDTNMLLNNTGDLVLIGGHSDWATWGGSVPLELAIDGGAPVKMTAQTINNLILVLIKDAELLERLGSAKYLDWTIPTGHVRGEVSGLGVALNAMKACKASNS